MLRTELTLVPAACVQMERRETDRSKVHSLEIICRVGITTLQAVCCVYTCLCKPVNRGHKSFEIRIRVDFTVQCYLLLCMDVCLGVIDGVCGQRAGENVWIEERRSRRRVWKITR